MSLFYGEFIKSKKHHIHKVFFCFGAWNWLNCCLTLSVIEQNMRKFCQLNPDRNSSVTSRLNPACWSASFTLCLIRIVTFFNVAPSESRGPLTQNKLNYSYVMLVADCLYFWHWYLNQLNAAYQTWRVSGFSSSSLWYVKNIITEHAVEWKWHM